MDKIFIIDASGYLYRSYFAIREMTNSKGESTNALYGFIRCLMKLIKDFQPTHLVSVFDGPRNAIKRTTIYADYKAHRQEMPKDLRTQIVWAHQFCELMGIASLNVPEVEADDTMASVARWAAEHNSQVYLCSSDKDMCQMVSDKIFMLNTFKDNQIMGVAEVEKQFGVPPHKIVDFLAITGDASDNVPGLAGFGPKTAADLLQKFGTLDYILDHVDEVPGKKKQETLLQDREKALISRELVTVDVNVAFPKEFQFFKIKPPSIIGLKELYTQMNFSSLSRDLDQMASEHHLPSYEEQTHMEEELKEYHLISNEKELRELVELLSKQAQICVKVQSTDTHPFRTHLSGIGFGFKSNEAWYVPICEALTLETIIEVLKPLFENSALQFYGHNFKSDYQILQNYGIKVAHIGFDTILASYLLNSHGRQHSLEHLISTLFDKSKANIQSLVGKGKKQLSIHELPLDKICDFCCEEVDYIVQIKNALEPQLEKRGLSSLFFDLELPLLPILAQMERHGIFIDTRFLQNLSVEVMKEIRELETEIYALAGESFNINSPKQLSQILFEKLGIKAPKKTATGLSTNADVLESLKEAYPIAAKLLEYRTLEKLRSTYIDALPLEINPVTQRIHCNFNQSVTATGRLASQEPNLQNIPVRTEIGRKIREAFRPQKQGWSYLAADYSQIELRLLAHLSEDPKLMQAFETKSDVHTYTASLIFDVPLGEVTREQRYQAKTVNFGILYGQQAFGLSQELKIDVKTAGAFIHTYFERYHDIKKFIDHSKEIARQSGRAVTLLGRERLIPEINSTNGMIRSAAERLAVNMPIQGSQADIIKLAMIEINQRLIKEKKSSFMILQIHDELIFEVPDNEIEEMRFLVKEVMENIMQLKIPLIVDIHVGKNWKEC